MKQSKKFISILEIITEINLKFFTNFNFFDVTFFDGYEIVFKGGRKFVYKNSTITEIKDKNCLFQISS